DDGAGKPNKLMDGVIVGFVPSSVEPNVGDLLFVQNASPGTTGPLSGTLMAQRFDIRKLKTVGDPVPISDGGGVASASLTGVLVIARPDEIADQLTIFDHQWNILQTLGEPDQYSRVWFSPDGSRVIAARGSGTRQLWVFDLARGLPSRFPTDPAGGAFP